MTRDALETKKTRRDCRSLTICRENRWRCRRSICVVEALIFLGRSIIRFGLISGTFHRSRGEAVATVPGQPSANLLECLCVSLAELSPPPHRERERERDAASRNRRSRRRSKTRGVAQITGAIKIRSGECLPRRRSRGTSPRCDARVPLAERSPIKRRQDVPASSDPSPSRGWFFRRSVTTRSNVARCRDAMESIYETYPLKG